MNSIHKHRTLLVLRHACRSVLSSNSECSVTYLVSLYLTPSATPFRTIPNSTRSVQPITVNSHPSPALISPIQIP
jgi:hypothetical protein